MKINEIVESLDSPAPYKKDGEEPHNKRAGSVKNKYSFNLGSDKYDVTTIFHPSLYINFPYTMDYEGDSIVIFNGDKYNCLEFHFGFNDMVEPMYSNRRQSLAVFSTVGKIIYDDVQRTDPDVLITGYANNQPERRSLYIKLCERLGYKYAHSNTQERSTFMYFRK